MNQTSNLNGTYVDVSIQGYNMQTSLSSKDSQESASYQKIQNAWKEQKVQFSKDHLITTLICQKQSIDIYVASEFLSWIYYFNPLTKNSSKYFFNDSNFQRRSLHKCNDLLIANSRYRRKRLLIISGTKLLRTFIQQIESYDLSSSNGCQHIHILGATKIQTLNIQDFKSKINVKSLDQQNSQDNQHIISDVDDNRLVIRNLITNQKKIIDMVNKTMRFVVSPCDNFIACIYDCFELVIRNLNYREEIVIENKCKLYFADIRFSLNSKYIAANHGNTELTVWDVKTGKYVQSINSQDRIISFAFTLDSLAIVVNSLNSFEIIKICHT